MAQPIDKTPILPRPILSGPTPELLARYDAALNTALYQILLKVAGRLNLAAMGDGSEGVVPRLKTVTESVNTSTDFQDDDELSFPVAANTDYTFEFEVYYTTPTAADFKWQLTGPASSTLVLYNGFALPPGATSFTITRDSGFSSSHSLTETSGTSGYVLIRGILHNGVNAGNVTLQWAQNTSNGSNTSVLKASSVRWSKIFA